MEATILKLPGSQELEAKIKQQEDKLEPYYQGEFSGNQISQSQELALKDVFVSTTHLLELLVVISLMTETVASLQLKTFGELYAQAKPIQESVQARTELNVSKVLKENLSLLASGPATPPPEKSLELSVLFCMRRVCSFLLIVPLRVLETMSKALGLPSEGRRCKYAYQILEAFVSRHQPKLEQQLSALGPAYQEGRLSLEEIGQALGLPVWDVIPELERLGFSRSVEKLILEEEEQARILLKIREDRLARMGKTAVNRDEVAREVLASQRIEGIDARPWLTPKA